MADDEPAYRDEDRLRELYHGEELSQREIAERFGCCRKTITNWMARYDIPVEPGERISKARTGQVYSRVETVCDHCGDDLMPFKSNVESGDHNFCNADCYHEWRRGNPSIKDPPDTSIDKKDLLADLRRLSEELGNPPSTDDIVDHGKFAWNTYVNHFGSVPAARAAAGLAKHIPFGEPGLRLFTGRRHPYGDRWREKRRQRIERDGGRCVVCGITESQHESEYGVGLSVHHIQPARGYDNLEDADQLDNLVTLCSRHHRVWEDIPVVPQIAD